MNAAVVELAGVGRTYPGHPPTEALTPCDLMIHTGDFVTIEGPSGSGKSTLLNILGLLDRPTSGTYRLDGIAVNELSERQRTAVRGQRIAFVFQSFQLLSHRSAIENVALSLLYRRTGRREQLEAALMALDAVGLSHRRHALPTHLSGGERQRVAIARALAANPSLLLCDEPTGNLDTRTSGAILELFSALNDQGRTVILITHDPAIAEYGTRRIQISDGVLRDTTGAPAEQP